MEIQKQEVILKIEDLTKSFGKTEVLKGISMEVHKNEIISVLGPSGCGKSTLLNIIAGMLSPDGGRVIMVLACRSCRLSMMLPKRLREQVCL